MKTYMLTWSPEGKMIANNVQAESPSKAKLHAPKPYKKFKGEIAVDELFWFEGNHKITLSMTIRQAKSASHQGKCDEDVAFLCRSSNIKEQLESINVDDLKAELKEYGTWDAEQLVSHDDNIFRLVWIAACNIEEAYSEALRAAAKEAIEKGKTIAYDVAANCGQIFGNVKHMSWFIDAVADEIEEN